MHDTTNDTTNAYDVRADAADIASAKRRESSTVGALPPSTLLAMARYDEEEERTMDAAERARRECEKAARDNLRAKIDMLYGMSAQVGSYLRDDDIEVVPNGVGAYRASVHTADGIMLYATFDPLAAGGPSPVTDGESLRAMVPCPRCGIHRKVGDVASLVDVGALAYAALEQCEERRGKRRGKRRGR